MNLSPGQKIYFVGIKGIAMAALAILAKQKGYSIAGSDTKELFPADEQLSNVGIMPLIGFDGQHVRNFAPDLVIYTGAHAGRDNIEVREAVRLNIPVLAHGKALGWFMEGYRQVSVAGCHGKTTTASMLAAITMSGHMDCSFAIGTGLIGGVGAAGHSGRGEWFIAEADEYITDPGHDTTPRFLWQHPEILVVTNIDFDHPDAYRDIDHIKDAYRSFANTVPPTGAIIYNSRDEHSEILSAYPNSVSVGEDDSCDIVISGISGQGGVTKFLLTSASGTFPVQLRVPGVHNVFDAAMAAGAALRMGVPIEIIQRGLSVFTGAKRRFEQIAIRSGVVFYDDYAHHPAEIRATLAGARFWYPGSRIIAVFQPHTYSRTIALSDEFSQSFGDADMVIFSDIYASAREKTSVNVSGRQLTEKTTRYHTHALYGPGEKEIQEILKATIRPKDVIIFMGAGDIYTWGKRIAESV